MSEINWTEIIKAGILSLPPTLVALLAYLQGRSNGRAVQKTHDVVNSRMTEMIGLVGDAKKAEGKLEAKVEQSQGGRRG